MSAIEQESELLETLTGNAEGNQQPSLWMPGPGAERRFIDYPEREYPSKHVTDRSRKQRQMLLDLPNFDAGIFEEITGIIPNELGL